MNHETYYLNAYETIGQGATFNVKRVRIDKAFHEFGLPVEVAACKRLRRFPEPDSAERSRQLATFIQELRTLCHKPLRDHENIVTLLGVGFEPNFVGHSDPWPVLLLEYADYGSLAKLQGAYLSLRAQTKVDLALDVALGLQALHACGIVHGDVENENVLVFSHKERGYVAKIGDFGYSVFSDNTNATPTGTRPWGAPELAAAPSAVSSEDLLKADMYARFSLIFLGVIVEI
jgi:serine/threonine protein kinase